MDFFLDFYYSSLEVCKTMLTQFAVVARLMLSPHDDLSRILGFPVSIITVMLGAGVTVYIYRALMKFFTGF